MILLFRNLFNHYRKNLFLVILLFLILAVLVLANSLFEGSEIGLRKSYQETLSGDIIISQFSEDKFNIFGSETPLLGEYLVPPVLQDYEKLVEILEKDNRISGFTSLITSAGQTSVRGKLAVQPLLGINFQNYRRIFPGLEIVEGAWPDSNEENTIFLSVNRYEELKKLIRKPMLIGTAVLVTAANNNSFTIRELKLGGVFKHPVPDPLLDRVALVDARVARALNGYVYGIRDKGDISTNDEAVLNTNVGDLFNGSVEALDSNSGVLDLQELEKSLFQTTEVKHSQAEDSGAWNHILLRMNPGVDSRQFLSDWNQNIKKNGYPWIVRDWREAVGGNAQLAWMLQIILNAGLIFIAFGSMTIIINALALSVFERTKEIGTMRALGAQKRRVAFLIGGESFLLTASSGILGIILGVLFSLVVDSLEVSIDNPLIRALFGGSTFTTSVSWNLIFSHLLLVIMLGFTSTLYPIHKALKLTPLKAMGIE